MRREGGSSTAPDATSVRRATARRSPPLPQDTPLHYRSGAVLNATALWLTRLFRYARCEQTVGELLGEGPTSLEQAAGLRKLCLFMQKYLTLAENN